MSFPGVRVPHAVSGLVEFESVPEAVDAVALCNHAAVSAPDKPDRQFTFKLCFSVNHTLKDN